MRLASLVIAAAVASCGKPAPPAPATTRIPVLPDAITARLGTIGLAIAVDRRALDARMLLGSNAPPCVQALASGVRDAVATVGLDGWQGIADGVDPGAARACLAELGIAVRDGAGGALELDAFGKALAVRWRGDVATLAESGKPERAGEAPDAMKDVIAQVPRGVAAWFATTGLPVYKVGHAVGWLEVSPATWTITVTATSDFGAPPTAAKAWIDSLVRGFSVALAARGTVVDGSWFTTTATPPTAKLVATIPLAALEAR